MEEYSKKYLNKTSNKDQVMNTLSRDTIYDIKDEMDDYIKNKIKPGESPT